ncbi:hypothetical protein FHX49_002169 [Microbacterium endophyticum]|uniref:Uncharacterized protein n=1 Tax=Microbacterium endophyticum TaxID=1526412 RepID=A0A7W4V4C8_9MICO|nr:hypothetical protein [Microbacterium endophyticum]NIK37527.1 hypothetical protein [Microbacterium endophyticum]
MFYCCVFAQITPGLASTRGLWYFCPLASDVDTVVPVRRTAR